LEGAFLNFSDSIPEHQCSGLTFMSEQDRFSVEPDTTFTPFWRRLPQFFLYPMQTGSMMRIAGYSVFGGISMFIPDTFGGILRLILWIVFLKYAFVVMERTANGQFDEPNDVNGKEEGDAAQVVRQFGLLVMIGLLFGLLAVMFGKIGFGLGWLLMNVLPPAGIMIIAVTRSLWQAINPAQIFFYIKTIGSPYLALCFVLISVTGSGHWLQVFLYRHMDSWLALPLLSFVEFYFTLITYHMMGYAIYQYHEKLGVHADVSFEEAEAKLSPGKAADPALTKLNSLIANGQQEEAIDLLREELRTHWENNDLHERYQKLLIAADKKTPAIHHAREFIDKLVTEKRLFRAMDLCEQSLKIDPEFQLQNSNHVHELASAANIGKRQKLAIDLMRRFDRRYPDHPHIPSVYLLSAKILSEHYQMKKEALQILQALQTQFPDHAIAGEARQYMEVLNNPAVAG
jgi:tetratricopeptide (TPR) repeat protein